MVREDVLELAGIIAAIARADSDLSGYAIGSILIQMRRTARGARKQCENQCNGIPRWNKEALQYFHEWTEADDARLDKALDRADKKLAALAVTIGCEFLSHQRDPRGPYAGFRVKPRLAEENGRTLEFRM